jgi:hypothetical protein
MASKAITSVAKTLHASIGFERWPSPECTQCVAAAESAARALLHAMHSHKKEDVAISEWRAISEFLEDFAAKNGL